MSRLPEADVKRISESMVEVVAVPKDVLYEPNKPLKHVYFPETSVGSILTVLEDGTQIEVATVGYEGMIGLPVFLGAAKNPGRAFWQVPGRGFRMDVEVLRDETRSGGPLSKALGLYTQGFFTQIAQSVTCNRLHTAQQRCSHWLLMTHDRVDGDEFTLTHEFLAQMLGIRRTGVTEVAGALQRAGLIQYSRGHITIIDRKGLEEAACECHRVVQAEFNRLLG